MKPLEYLGHLSAQLSYLYYFARKMNELDFAAALSGEFRGAQDAGWATTVTAQEVFYELSGILQDGSPKKKSDLRVVLMLYCQLAEAGGVYETIKNLMGVITSKPYNLWPFQDLVRVKNNPKRIIGPNANATFRDLATMADNIGMSGLSALLEGAFRDDIRNGISHADYVLWDDGLRLRKRNGGYATRISIDEVNEALTTGVGFFQILRELTASSIQSFHPPREIVGRLSANFPMPWTVSFDPETGSFGLSGSSPGPVTTKEFERQEQINNRLGGRVFCIFKNEGHAHPELEGYISSKGFNPNYLLMDATAIAGLESDIAKYDLWDSKEKTENERGFLICSPLGFRRLFSYADFDEILPKPLVDFEFG